MLDEFDEKHKMMQKLLGMLKEHSSNEVSSGLQKPEGEGDMHGLQVEKVEVLPDHAMDHSTPEHDVDTKLVDDHMSEGGMAYSKGGVVEKVNATDPTPKIHSGPIPYESADGQPDMEGAVHKEVLEPLETREAKSGPEEEQEPHDREYADPEEEQSSMFKSFLSRKKKK